VLAAARVGFDAERPVHYVLFGLFCGFAMGTKYTGLIAVALLFACAFYLVIMVHGQDKKSTLKHLAIAAAVAAAVAGPWYIRNWILLGCPIYPPPPVLLRFFHVEQHLPREGIERLVVRMWTEGRGMGRGPLTFLLLPFHLTYHPANFINGAGGIGLAPLAFAPFGLLVCRKNSFAKALALFALLSMAAWFVTAQEARYLIHGYLIATIFAVWGWRYVVRTAPRFAPALSGVLLGVSISYGLFMIASMNKEDLHAVLSPSFENKRKRDEIPFLDAFEYLNRARSVDKVLVLNPRVPTYYLDKTYLKPIGRWGEQTLPEGDKLSQILSELPRLRISHIMDVRLEGTDFRLPEHPQGLTLVFERADQRVYRAE
jgi:4-amino-4-deoxy-L-arabinose transferase-like glycosyltransferase